MKKICIFFTIVLMFASCKQEDDDNINIDDFGDYHIGMNVFNFEISHWTKGVDADNNIFYFCNLDVPEITSELYSYGTIIAYNVMSDVQVALPYVRHFKSGDAMWTRTVDYDFSPGKMTVYVTNSDFFDEVPSAMSLRVVLLL
jgi:hypothetical protein